jgi:pre-rRNA-processing protein IPI3
VILFFFQSTPANAYDREEMLRDHAFFTKPTAVDSGAGAVASTARVQELEDEVARLREQLSKAKGVNDAMWETVVRKVVTTSTDEGEGPRRKKGKA